MRRLDAMIAISRFTREGFLRHCPNGVRVVDIPNGVDVAAFAETVPRPPGLDPAIEPGRYVLFIGRLVGRKGADVLLDALARIPDGGAVQLVLAGDGQEKAKLLAQCDRLHLKHRVRFVGMVGGAVKKYLLQNAVAVAMPSRRWEGFPLVVLESYAAGTPVIASDVEGLGELIDASRAGMVFPSESAVELAAHLRSAFDERTKMFLLGESARRFAAQYDWDRIVRRHLELFEGLLRRESPLREAA
jgi:glycosyltransferase involved in cell wall biosynthesis